MKRSEIDRIIEENIRFMQERCFFLPSFACWTPGEWREKGEEYREIRYSALGWDITDFGSGDFHRVGLFLFTLRNGNQKNSAAYPKPYAEKIMAVEAGQITPLHYHWYKMEDIINRGPGILVIRLYNADPATDLLDKVNDVTVHHDGRTYTAPAGITIRLDPGESVTLYPKQYHTFTAERQKTLVGEVSQCNDDQTDNRFLTPAGRFPSIEEDAPARFVLCNEYPF